MGAALTPQMFVFRDTLIVLLIVEPHGFAHLWQIAKEKLKAVALPVLSRSGPVRN